MRFLSHHEIQPHRVDARRNREVILRVADGAFARDVDVVLDEVAREAGLARATVYRHFPDRTALGTAVAARHLAALKRAVDETGPQRRSFRELLEFVLRMQAERRPLVRLFRELPERFQRQYIGAVLAVIKPAFNRAQREGHLRGDLELTDFALLFEMHEGALNGDPGQPDRAQPAARLLQAMLDGLFSCPTPMAPSSDASNDA